MTAETKYSWQALENWLLPEQASHTPTLLRDGLRAALGARERSVADASLGRASAVLVPLFTRDDATHLWLLRRSDSMRRHKGQVAFPGGTHDDGDATLLDTALREAQEEVALAAADVDVLGALDDLVTGTGYVITPYVAWVAPAFVPSPNADEVARVFSTPLAAFAAQPAGEFPRVGWHIEGELVWGATCAMIVNLFNVVRAL